jgi:PAS domain S-box-containing protein
VSQASWGYRPDEVMGQMYFYDIHPKEGREMFKAAMFTLIERKQPFRDVVHAIQTKDGRAVWGSTYGIPLLNADGTLRGYGGSCTDVTDRKLADEALASVGHRLIEAQEVERTWIARELHDDVNQRIVLLALELERWEQQIPDSTVQFHNRIRRRLLDLARDIQALSHRLHSSKLEYLGIAAAARSFCEEVTEQHKVEIDFRDTNIPDDVPGEISLCLFRVFQEAVQNAVKHSGVRQFAVHLQGTAGEIQLIVSDLGVGFDPHRAINGRGLGLISMRERLHLAGGRISIESQPGRGTTIHARVPFNPTNNSELAAG